MNPVARNGAKGAVDHALPFQPANAGKGRTFDLHGEMRFPAAIVTRMAEMLGAVVVYRQPRGGQRLAEQGFHLLLKGAGHAFSCFRHFLIAETLPILMRMRPTRFHGRHENSGRSCDHPDCDEAGEFRAPGSRRPSFEGPGEWRWFCLDHVRAFNAGYDWFEGMSADEILAAQSPVAGWETETRAFRPTAGVDGLPRWADHADPLDAIAARAQGLRDRAGRRAAAAQPVPPRFTREEAGALSTMGLADKIDLAALRRRYSELVRRYHPDRNGGDRRHEDRLTKVVEAYQLLRRSAALKR